MMAEKHTPGPWMTGTGCYGHFPIYVMRGGEAKLIAQTVKDGETGIEYWEGSYNARLMAAAPELLKALRSFVEGHHECSARHCQIEEDALMAISKVEGRNE